MGIFWAVMILALWAAHLVWLLFFFEISWTSVLTYAHVLIQAYLYTGLFITAHDSMHGSVSANRRLNRVIGTISLRLFAAFSYQRMFSKHMAHHRHPGTDMDPDFSVGHQNPIIWFVKFFFRYVTVIQILIMAGLFNIGMYLLGIPTENLLLFWVLPAFLGTFQLFYFGTYLPHRYPHTEQMAPHNSRTQRSGHLLAMLSCYFFGYHYEHHEYPRTPWWRLYQRKKEDASDE